MEPIVRIPHFALLIHEAARARHLAKAVLQKFSVLRTVNIKANVLAVARLGIHKAVLLGDFTHFAFHVRSKRRKHMIATFIGNPEQKVALVLAGVATAQKPAHTIHFFDAHVMPCRQEFGAERFGVIHHPAKLDKAIAITARVRRTRMRKVRMAAFQDFTGKCVRAVCHMMLDAKLFSNHLRTDYTRVVFGIKGAIDIGQNAERHAHDFVTLLLQKKSGYGRIHATAHADCDFGFRHSAS